MSAAVSTNNWLIGEGCENPSLNFKNILGVHTANKVVQFFDNNLYNKYISQGLHCRVHVYLFQTGVLMTDLWRYCTT